MHPVPVKTPENHSKERSGKRFHPQARGINTLMQTTILFKFNTDKPEDQQALYELLQCFMQPEFPTICTVFPKIGWVFVTTKAPLKPELHTWLEIKGLNAYRQKRP